MPKRSDITSILIIGSGPIIIGQGAEFDYSGVQACRALKAEGYRVILVNSNPATVMTDPELADATYIEPITWQVLEQIIAQERPDALLSTMGGQTALNCALELANNGVLAAYNVELIGASIAAIDKAESRDKFKLLVMGLGFAVPNSFIARDIAEAIQSQKKLGFPVMVRASYTLGGSGSGIADNTRDFLRICTETLALSPTHEILIEEALIGWKEFELEIVRDCKDNCIVVCTIENIDPMGIHTGDSATVAPAQTLTDKEYQQMRNAAFAILREIGVDTGGANVQFAVNPKDGRMVVIEVNPRVSRSSALASKATGFPIAKVAAKLAIGYTLDELQNEIVGGLIPIAFEPTLDYVAVKLPKFDFERFPSVKPELTTRMQSVGEVMALGTTFMAALQKAIISLDEGFSGLDIIPAKAGIHSTKIDPWFAAQIERIIALEKNIAAANLSTLTEKELRVWKQSGFSDQRLAAILACSERELRDKRLALGINMTFTRVDSCAAEFPVHTAYLYGGYGDYCEANPSNKQKVIILGSGPNRIGQGLEFDYCCVQAVLALKELGYETIMINCNPETISTDYDIADRLYFEPITVETVLAIVALEKPLGVMVQFGGQTPLKIAQELENAGVKILGTSPTSIAHAEDRQYFHELVQTLQLQQAPSLIARNAHDLLLQANQLGYPLIARPSYVIGGKAMEIIITQAQLMQYIEKIKTVTAAFPILLERYLKNAIEVDVDAIVDAKGEVFIAGIMEHIEFAGIHSGDSACVLPAHTLPMHIQDELIKQISQMAKQLKVIGLMNAQFAIQEGVVYVLEVNPRASRTIPFVSKAIGLPLCKIAVLCVMGKNLSEQKIQKNCNSNLVCVKYPIFSWLGPYAADFASRGPEMKSTGEIMGIATSFVEAYAKCLRVSGLNISALRNVNMHTNDKQAIAEFIDNGEYSICKLQ